MTPRERSILRETLTGDPYKIIAFRLGITERTLKVYVSHMYSRYGFSNHSRTALALYAIEHPELL